LTIVVIKSSTNSKHGKYKSAHNKDVNDSFHSHSIVVRGNSLWAIKKITIPCEPLKKFGGLQRYCFNFFLPSMPLPSDWALTVSNYRGEKSKIPLGLNMPLIFFEHLSDFKWKNSKLESCTSRWDLQFSYKNYLHLILKKGYELIWLIYLRKKISFCGIKWR